MFHTPSWDKKKKKITFKRKPLSRTLFIQTAPLWKVNNSDFNTAPDPYLLRSALPVLLWDRDCNCSFPHSLSFFLPNPDVEYLYTITTEVQWGKLCLLQDKYCNSRKSSLYERGKYLSITKNIMLKPPHHRFRK